MLKFLLADDHAVVRRGVRQILEDAYGATFGEATNATEALELVWKEPWDVVILDVTMPGRSGLDVLKEIKQSKPRLPVLVLSMHPEDQFAVRVLKAGAAGYLNKDSAPEALVSAVKKVMSGGRYISPALAEQLASAVSFDASRPRHERLSDREFEVFKLIASGRAVGEVAAELSLSAKTISTYRTRLLEKMGLQTNAELTRYAFENRLVE